MSDRSLIEALEGADDPDKTQRRRYYQLTDLGRTALKQEVTRMQHLLDQERATEAFG